MAEQIPVPPLKVPADEYDLGTDNPFSLEGRHALVTGADGALGLAIAMALAEAGAKVSVTTLVSDGDQETAAGAVLEACRELDRAGTLARADLTDPASTDAAVETIVARSGPIDILVNAAHGANIRPILSASLEEWRSELDRNATSVFVACQAVGRRMVERGYGRIINLSSVVHDRAVPNAAIFAASQGAVYGFTKSLGVEWGRSGVTANVLTLGFIEGVPGLHADEEVRAILERYIPLRRLGTPDDIKGAIVYMASDFAEFLDSESVTVDGAIQVHA